jgi:hypothetical protein
MKSPGSSTLKRSRWQTVLIWGVAVFLVYVLLGFFVLPPIIKWQLLKKLPGITKRQVEVGQVKFNPLVLSLTVRGLALNEPDGHPFASWDELYINFQTSSLFRWAWTFKEIRLDRPLAEIIVLKDGRLNFANMFESPTNTLPPSKTDASSIPRVNIFQLEITNGFVAMEDRSRRSTFRTEWRPINLVLKQFATRPNADTPYSFHAESDAGRSITWQGDLTVQPFHSGGHLEITGVKLPRWRPYLEDMTRAVLTNGVADFQVNYRIAVGTNGFDLSLSNGTLHVEQVQLQDLQTAENVVGFRTLDVQSLQFDLRERTARLGNLKLAEPTVLARLKPDGHLNLIDLLIPPAPSTNPPPASTNPAAPWTITVDEFNLENGVADLEDLTRRSPFKTELKPIAVKLEKFTTEPDSDGRYSLGFTSELAETLSSEGTFSINPVRSTGEVKVAAVELKKYVPYVEDIFRGRITAGQLAVQVPYYMALATNGLQAGVSNLAVTLTGLDVKGPGSDTSVASISQFGLEEVEANLQERRARVGHVKASGGSIFVQRAKDGSINLLGLLASNSTNTDAASTNVPAAKTPVVEAPAAGSNTWVASVGEFSLKDYAIKIEDLQPSKPAKFLLDQVALDLKDASIDRNVPMGVALSLRFNETGAIALQGTTRLDPLSADFQVGLTNLDMRGSESYLEPYVRLGIASGGFSAYHHIRYQTTDPQRPRITIAGGLGITNFRSTDLDASKEFLRWDDLAISGVELGLLPNGLKVEQIKWIAPATSVVIGPDHQANLSHIFNKTASGSTNGVTTNAITTATSPTPSTNAAPADFPMQLGAFVLDRAVFEFTDESIQPPVSVGLQELTGSIKGLSSAPNTTADVNLAGKIDRQSPFTAIGHINPLAANLTADLVISNANMQLTPFTAYLEKYAGHPLRKGRLNTALHYQIEGKQIQAQNKIDIDQLTLGPRNNSPDATTLPVKLGIALLKDSQGRIDLDIPVSGRLDDPHFRVSAVVLKVIVNMITKAAASPFKLLGALVGGGGEELSFVQFSPGSTNLIQGELDKLAKLAKALAQRPTLELEIEGAIDPVADRQALAAQKLRDQIKTQGLQELNAKGGAPQSTESFVVGSKEYDRLLRRAFVEQFGTNTAAVLQAGQFALSTTNQPATPGTGPTEGQGQRSFSLRTGATPEKKLSKADRLALNEATPPVMERLLAEKIEISDSDFRQLMEARARLVQDWLVSAGGVSADRLLLDAPKPVDSSYRGQSRAVLSVD